MVVRWWVDWLMQQFNDTIICRVSTTDNNQLTGTIPTELGRLTSLTSLNLGKIGNVNCCCTNVDGDWWLTHVPFYVDTIVACKMMTDTNQLNGAIPSDIRRLTNLTYLDLGELENVLCGCCTCSDWLTQKAILGCMNQHHDVCFCNRCRPTHRDDPNGDRTTEQSHLFGSLWVQKCASYGCTIIGGD